MSSTETVVFTAGARIELTTPSAAAELERALGAAAIAGSSASSWLSSFRTPCGRRTSEGFENYIAVKKRADVYFLESHLQWVIIRVGTLLEDSGTERVRADVAIPGGEVSRDDVAGMIEELIEQPTGEPDTSSNGRSVPVADAARRLAHQLTGRQLQPLRSRTNQLRHAPFRVAMTMTVRVHASSGWAASVIRKGALRMTFYAFQA